MVRPWLEACDAYREDRFFVRRRTTWKGADAIAISSFAHVRVPPLAARACDRRRRRARGRAEDGRAVGRHGRRRLREGDAGFPSACADGTDHEPRGTRGRAET